jgi:uncharacterized cupin superfamily protein
METKPIPAADIPPTLRKTNYPEPFAALVEGRTRRRLGDYFGLSNFGVNLTELAPGAISALLHAHAKQDEFIYVLQGHPILRVDDAEYSLKPGDCMGFKAGTGVAHQLINQSDAPVLYLEMGDRIASDSGEYPKDDLRASLSTDGTWIFTHKDGSPY